MWKMDEAIKKANQYTAQEVNFLTGQLDASIDSINTELGRKVNILTTGSTAEGYEFTFPHVGTFLLVGKGVSDNIQYCILVGTWSNLLRYIEIVPTQQATITFEGLKVTVHHNRWSAFSIIRLANA